MAKTLCAFICLLIVVMDVIAGILGIAAEIEQNKGMKHLRVWIFECRDPSEKAFKLGLAAAKLLVLAHVIANMLGVCNCICSQEELRRASLSRKLSVALLIFTWIVFAVGLSMLAIGTSSNQKSKASCGFSSHHFLSLGGNLCFVHGLFSLLYYVSSTATLS
ncbi:protein VASCULATURE COMPLEXITY AND CONNECTIVITY-like [Quercus robur]|uniref:protein VASCULATURE COMPLEXITY AND CONNECTIVITY-like n=1 Tax=Quercus robur TaxID=38942 RepID=UPI002163DA03|nr:protein VASCULATURE COMPLEXITY AND CONNECTIVITY-like [Quercus robur]